MADKQSYLDLATVNGLFARAAEGDEKAIGELAEILEQAESQVISTWKEKVRKVWMEGIANVVSGMKLDALSPEDMKFLKVMLKFKLEGMENRERYAALAKAMYPEYQNPTGMVEAIGCNEVKNNLTKVAARMAMMAYVVPGTLCYDMMNGIGEVIDVDALNSEVTLRMQRQRTISLQHFIDSAYVIKADSILAQIVSGKFEGKFANAVEFFDAMNGSIVSVQPFSVAIIKRMLVPAKMSESMYSNLIGGKEAGGAKAGKSAKGEKAEVVAAPAADTAVASVTWDTSRSIKELNIRLQTTSSLKMANPNLENIKGLLGAECTSANDVQEFALAVATLYKGGIYNFELGEMLRGIVDKAVCWTPAVFVEISDKLPGKLVPFWFQATQEIMGSEWLVDNTLKMPFNLWTHTEKLLESNPAEKTMLADKVFDFFKAGKVNAEMFYWLWKKAPKGALRSKYMSDSYLLFSVLRVDVKGSYLKSKRLLYHLLLEDESFQRSVMGEGDEKAIQALAQCVKHLPLLDIDERQAMLVKIVRIYGDVAKKYVEKRETGPLKRNFGRFTSLRGYYNTEMELKELVEVQIPENTAAIGHARSLGDLRENSEYKYAKERQRALNARRGELEYKLSSIRVFKFADVNLKGSVEPGCVVTIQYEDQHTESFTLLGLLDGHPEKNIISYETELGKALLEKTVGDEIVLPAGDEVKIIAINPLSADMIAWLDSVE